ncbi:GNAT family N-acetyltransferase [Falsigemmobacter faecalis]|uniref:N-acetyltransferase family protein n=1 Tax=Falsigemmobacter faecalis TaxID=2488730 RepID=A0A3P3DQ36_9RHOB|nr:GNAT family N-acetyltransferase [Falsigemmobacter faecalis]RRH76340.1 N-acetyltransferase family protein [Falsigemmobacter faecalis]
MIRPARSDDAAKILEFWNPLIRDTLVTFNPQEKSVTELQASIRDKAVLGHGFLVWDAGGQILGFASYTQFRGGDGYRRAMEHTIILAPEAHGKGIGRRLMTAIEDHARGRGHHIMVAGVSGGNPAGRAFHAAIGYHEAGIIREAGFKFGTYHDLILMQKILN